MTVSTQQSKERTGDLRGRFEVGGKWRFILRGPDGKEMGMRGAAFIARSYRERTVHMESFDDYPGESQVTGVFVEEGGKTTLTATVLYPSREVHDIVIKSRIEHGAAETYDKLAEYLASVAPDRIPSGRPS